MLLNQYNSKMTWMKNQTAQHQRKEKQQQNQPQKDKP